MTRRLRLRLLAAVIASVLFLAVTTGLSRSRQRSEVSTAEPRAGGAVTPTPTPVPTLPELPDSEEAAPRQRADVEAALRSPDAAEQLGGAGLLEAGLVLAQSDWAELGHPAWPASERPVYVVDAHLDAEGRVQADVVIASRLVDATDEIVLRLLPAAEVLSAAAGDPEIDVRVDGADASHVVDPEGARLRVFLPSVRGADEAVLLRIRLRYQLADRAAIVDDGGPAGFGLLARSADVMVLGHWVPLLTFDDGPMVPWGDVGAYPAAVWSVTLRAPHPVVTGGADGPCPGQVEDITCTWARGVALREVAAVALTDTVQADGLLGRLALRVTALERTGAAAAETALDEFRAAVETFSATLGPLAWREVELVVAPLGRGAAGMEFPGLVILRDDLTGALAGGFGTYVIAHEGAHQWFHALVGNSSLRDPVVDESIAQYLSVVFWADTFGEGAARRLAENRMIDRYREARAAGLEDEPPAQPLAAFEGSAAYGPLVYGRGAMGWLAAEEAVGRSTVLDVLAAVVDARGLDVVTAEEMIELARLESVAVADVLTRYWMDPQPVE